jgi:hypothetical protein
MGVPIPGFAAAVRVGLVISPSNPLHSTFDVPGLSKLYSEYILHHAWRAVAIRELLEGYADDPGLIRGTGRAGMDQLTMDVCLLSCTLSISNLGSTGGVDAVEDADNRRNQDLKPMRPTEPKERDGGNGGSTWQIQTGPATDAGWTSM